MRAGTYAMSMVLSSFAPVLPVCVSVCQVLLENYLQRMLEVEEVVRNKEFLQFLGVEVGGGGRAQHSTRYSSTGQQRTTG